MTGSIMLLNIIVLICGVLMVAAGIGAIRNPRPDTSRTEVLLDKSGIALGVFAVVFSVVGLIMGYS